MGIRRRVCLLGQMGGGGEVHLVQNDRGLANPQQEEIASEWIAKQDGSDVREDAEEQPMFMNHKQLFGRRQREKGGQIR